MGNWSRVRSGRLVSFLFASSIDPGRQPAMVISTHADADAKCCLSQDRGGTVDCRNLIVPTFLFVEV